jgi:hypothetical protein
MLSSKWFWGVVAFAIVMAVGFVPRVGVLVLAPVAAILIGGSAAHFVMATRPATLGSALTAGAVAGLGALVATVLAFALFGYGLGLDPEIQEFVRTSEPHPEARLPYDWIAPIGAVLGAFIGIFAGMVNLALAALAGLVVGWFSVPAPSRSLKHMVG